MKRRRRTTKRPIDADDLDNVVLRLNEEGRAITRNDYKTVDSILLEFPTIEAEPVRRGRWIETDSEEPCFYYCSECKTEADDETRYCPNCGAKMDGGEERWNK